MVSDRVLILLFCMFTSNFPTPFIEDTVFSPMEYPGIPFQILVDYIFLMLRLGEVFMKKVTFKAGPWNIRKDEMVRKELQEEWNQVGRIQNYGSIWHAKEWKVLQCGRAHTGRSGKYDQEVSYDDT